MDNSPLVLQCLVSLITKHQPETDLMGTQRLNKTMKLDVAEDLHNGNLLVEPSLLYRNLRPTT
jgi:hypothetical protein